MDEGRYGGIARWESTTVRILGAVEVILAFMLLLPTAVAAASHEDVGPFLGLMLLLMVAGALQYLLFRESANFRAVNGLLLVALFWGLVFAVGSVPYMIAGMTPLDALFESVSGFTVTGATIMADIESWSNSILVWRSLSQWIGGIAIIIIFIYLLPMLGVGRNVFRNELAGSGSSEYSMKMKNAAKSFTVVYIFLSTVNFGLLLLCGVGLMDASCLAMTTISTGGMMCRNSSLADFSDIVQVITIFFMFMGGVNFYLHYRAIYRREKGAYRSNSEFKTMVVWLFGIAFLIYLMLMANTDGLASMSASDHLEVLKDSVFTTVSLGTTTAFTTVDYCMFPTQCIMLLMIVCFIGGSSGSTSGGIKINRLRVIYEFLKDAIGKNMRPNAVTSLKIDGKHVDNKEVMSTISIFMMYIITMFIGTVLITMQGLNFLDSFGLSISSTFNIGSGFGNFGPSGSLADLSPMVKMIFMALMWIGRLEVMLALVFFTPSFWKEVWLNRRSKRIGRRACIDCRSRRER